MDTTETATAPGVLTPDAMLEKMQTFAVASHGLGPAVESTNRVAGPSRTATVAAPVPPVQAARGGLAAPAETKNPDGKLMVMALAIPDANADVVKETVTAFPPGAGAAATLGNL